LKIENVELVTKLRIVIVASLPYLNELVTSLGIENHSDFG